MYTAFGDTQNQINNNLMDLQRLSITLERQIFAGTAVKHKIIEIKCRMM